jgi:hypothetical protein
MDAAALNNKPYLRLYYAGQIISGVASRDTLPGDQTAPNAKQLAHWAFELADAMVAEAEKHRT